MAEFETCKTCLGFGTLEYTIGDWEDEVCYECYGTGYTVEYFDDADE